MLRLLKEKEENIAQVLTELVEESAKGTPVLVEGKKDAEAIRILGVEGPILTVKTGGKSFFEIATGLENSRTLKVILLLDFDRRGKQGTNRLRQYMERSGMEVNLNVWRALLRLVGKDVQCVEGITTYLENLRLNLAANSKNS